MGKRSIHISYKKENRSRIVQSIMMLVDFAFKNDQKKSSDFSILDLGCGRGEFLKEATATDGFKTIGLDIDPICAQMSSKYTKCFCADIQNVDKLFPKDHFDLVLFSHALEHMERPVDIINKIKFITKKWIILIVPNPIRPKVLLKYDLFSRDYSNKGHFYCWDHSHFQNFVQRCCKLDIVKWAADEVRIIPFKPLRKMITFFGLLNFLELKILTRYFSYFSSSLIVLCKK